MDIQKAQRLSKHLSTVCDMVEYNDIRFSLVKNEILSNLEDQNLQNKLQQEGNFHTMQELLTVLNLRRGGFDSLLVVLRETDYVWVAEQLDPAKSYTAPSCSSNTKWNESKQSSIMTNVRQKILRKSEPAISSFAVDNTDALFASYRDSCPINIPINPSFYIENLSSSQTALEHKVSMEVQQTSGEIQNTEAASLLQKLNIDTDASTGKQVIVYNVRPEQTSNGTEYFSNLAKRANVPSPMLKGLKMVYCRTISKPKRAAVKLKFNSVCARNKFAENIRELITNVEPNDSLYDSISQLEVALPKSKGIFRRKLRKFANNSSNTSTVTNETSKEKSSSSNHWFKKPIKLWKREPKDVV